MLIKKLAAATILKAPAVFVLISIYLCLGLAPTADALAANDPTANDLQLETTLIQLVGEEQAARFRKVIDPEEQISWQVYLPDNDSTEPPGLFVCVSPMKTGRIDSRWREVMDQQNLIYISANDSGNKTPTIRRMVMANMAVKALAQGYTFDPAHIMVSGFSGGGRVASRLATQYPQVFTGALYICGVDFWKKDQTPDVERLLQNRFVFLTGSRDFNLRETKQIQRRYI